MSSHNWGETKSFVHETPNKKKEKEVVFSKTKRWVETRGFSDTPAAPKDIQEVAKEWEAQESTLGIEHKEQKPKMLTQRWNSSTGFSQPAPPLSSVPASNRNSFILPNSTNPAPLVRRSTTTNLGSGGEQCYFCSKRVFLMEKKVLDGKVFHGPCFKCVDCKKSMGVDAQVHWEEGKLYCHFHYLKYQDKVKLAHAAAPSAAPASTDATREPQESAVEN